MSRSMWRFAPMPGGPAASTEPPLAACPTAGCSRRHPPLDGVRDTSPQSLGKTGAMADRPEPVRDAFARQAWAEAYQGLAVASREALDAPDLERLAVAAYLIGHDDESVLAWEAAHRRYLEAGAPAEAARCSFWLALCSAAPGADRSGGRLARPHGKPRRGRRGGLPGHRLPPDTGTPRRAQRRRRDRGAGHGGAGHGDRRPVRRPRPPRVGHAGPWPGTDRPG